MHYKRYETCVGAKTTGTFVKGFVSLYTRAVGAFVPIKDAEAFQRDLKKDYVITKELSTLVGSLELKCGRLLMVANTARITTKHVHLERSVERSSTHPSRDVEDYPLSGVVEVPAQKSSATAKQLASIAD